MVPAMSFAADDGYGYPIPGSYEATILGTPAKLMPELPAKIQTRQLVLNVIPDRKKPPVFFYDKGLNCTFAYQKQKAPLVFLIAGAGASDRSAKLMTMMKALYQAGFHVITLPSPSHANFIISASQSSVPGDLTEDAADLYRAMESAWKQVAGDIEVTSFNLCGYSLGGSQAAFVAKLDEERRGLQLSQGAYDQPRGKPLQFGCQDRGAGEADSRGIQKAGHLFQQDAVQVQPVLPLWQFCRHQR